MPSTASIAARLAEAWRTGTPVTPPSRDLTDLDRPAAYRIQEATIGQLALGARRGWKLGLTSLATASEPFTGPIHEAMLGRVDLDRAIDPRIEVELAVVVETDVEASMTVEEIRRLPLALATAFEVIDDRTIPPAGDTDWIADVATMRQVVVGEIRPWTGAAFGSLVGTLRIDGRQVATGAVGTTVTDPLMSLAWLSAHLHGRGLGLKRGDIVITGSLTGQHPLLPGRRYDGEVTGLEPITIEVARSTPE